MKIRMESDPDSPESQIVKSENDEFLGRIRRVGPNEWMATREAGETPKTSSLHIGSHSTLQDAFNAFVRAVEDPLDRRD
jgi:hypothetical protein